MRERKLLCNVARYDTNRNDPKDFLGSTSSCVIYVFSVLKSLESSLGKVKDAPFPFGSYSAVSTGFQVVMEMFMLTMYNKRLKKAKEIQSKLITTSCYAAN